MKNKISAALEIGEIACQLLESPAMVGLLTTHLKEHEAVLIPILTVLIGEYIKPDKLLLILSDKENLKNFIANFKALKNAVVGGKTKIDSYDGIVISLLGTDVMRKIAAAILTQKAENKLAKVGVVIDELVSDIKKVAESFKEGAQQLSDKLSSKAKEVKAELGDKVDEAIDKAKELKAELAHKAKDFFKIKPKHKQSKATDLGQEIELVEKKPAPENKEVVEPEDKNSTLEAKPPVPTLPNSGQETKVRADVKKENFTDKLSNMAKASKEKALAEARQAVEKAQGKVSASKKELEEARNIAQKAAQDVESVGTALQQAIDTKSAKRSVELIKDNAKKAKKRVTEAEKKLKEKEEKLEKAKQKVHKLENGSTLLEDATGLLKKIGAKKEKDDSKPKAPKRPTPSEDRIGPPTLAH